MLFKRQPLGQWHGLSDPKLEECLRVFSIGFWRRFAVSWKGMAMEGVIEAAKLASAHAFILQLPQGYDTIVEERGSSLSGGQRQRIAIATDPKILIFDKATSARDFESEAAIQANTKHICEGRTVVIVVHRPIAVQYCGRIVRMGGTSNDPV